MSKSKDTYRFNYGEKGGMKIVVVKTGEVRGDVAKWFATDEKAPVEGDITNFFYDGRTGSMPTKIFDKNFTVCTNE
jgi:hypothetical protein